MTTREVMMTKPAACTCTYTVESSGSTTAFVRTQGAACPIRGHSDPMAVKIEAAVKVAMDLAKTVPGMENINEAQVRRLIKAAIPAFQAQVGGTTP